MKTTITIIAIIFSLGLNTLAQDCSTGRYVSEVFTTLNTTSDIQYGQNIDLNGNSQNLLLDVYEPQGDTMLERPLIIWAHGGSFVGGDKTSPDVVPLAEDFAKMGYVTASIDYRLGMGGLPFPGPDSVDATETVIRAVHDARASVRFFKKDYAENGNTYGIDTSNIFFGGVSAGGLMAVHLAYLDEESELPTSYVDTSQAGLGGGIAGNSGNAGYKGSVKAIISSAGALRDTAWMNAFDTPIISFHGDDDGTVPYGSAIIYAFGIYPIMMMDGSSSIHERAENLGMNHCFEPWPGQDHVPHVGSAAYYDTLVTMSANFLLQFVCGTAAICSYGTVGIDEASYNNDMAVEVYPNPSGSFARIRLGNNTLSNTTVQLYDSFGRKVRRDEELIGTELVIERVGLPSGMYFVKILHDEGQYTAKLIFE